MRALPSAPGQQAIERKDGRSLAGVAEDRGGTVPIPGGLLAQLFRVPAVVLFWGIHLTRLR